MRAGRILLAAFAAALGLAAYGAGASVQRRAPAAPAAAALAPAHVPALLDRRLQPFRDYLLDPARASGERFPAYDRWLRAVARAIRDGRALPSARDPLVVAGDAELARHRRPPPAIRAVNTLRAIREQTRLATLGAAMNEGFAAQPAAVRRAAAAHLLARYRL